jgi:Protein of unknown function (DUF2793)
MPSLETSRHKLPLLAISQAQKELTHNEALMRIDALLHATVIDELAAPPVVIDADIGKCWLVAASPVGDWAGKAGQIALWVGGSWRYLMPQEGMQLRQLSTGGNRIRSAGGWLTAPPVNDPLNGTVIDVEAREAIVALLQYFRMFGLIAP